MVVDGESRGQVERGSLMLAVVRRRRKGSSAGEEEIAMDHMIKAMDHWIASSLRKNLKLLRKMWLTVGRSTLPFYSKERLMKTYKFPPQQQMTSNVPYLDFSNTKKSSSNH